MRAPSKRVTFLFAFLAANFLLWFPFATTVDDGEAVEGVEGGPEVEGEAPGSEEPIGPEDDEE